MNEVTDATFAEKVLNADKPVLIDFWAEWCMPCKMLSPVLEEVTSELGDKAEIFKMNIDENQETPQKFGITSIPTLIVFKNGEQVENIVGAVPKNEIVQALNKHI